MCLIFGNIPYETVIAVAQTMIEANVARVGNCILNDRYWIVTRELLSEVMWI